MNSGISDRGRARPLQAAVASAVSFACGAALPRAGGGTGAAGVLDSGDRRCCHWRSWHCWAPSPPASAGPASGVGAMRVTVLGALAMALTLGIGALVGRFDP